ncbi:PREDICTED: probable E3 ubiquitin-protein ligase MARCH10 [Chrysochloris asiatica]|uniref:RING-type E3 ubiquitin transferase n=1 Tax=Chrysochloris asiatica TaxID=185453 RepID=A0A9B0T6M0_CHRAS|nr:PREDICTED: probable E3 ubiquitin-protein ligase MARCH10 [Chrysochloris asiatica]
MLHEGKERQKFISDAQYLRDMQHKVDSEYQACLRRQEHRRDPTEKKRDQFWGQETSLERSRFSSGSSSRQSSGEEDPLAEPRLTAKTSSVKCDSKLPAIDQTSVKQKHKSTMTPKKPEKAGPSKPSPADQAAQILSRKRRPNLGRLTVSPETQSPRASGDRSRPKSQLMGKVSALRGADPVIQQEAPVWASDTKLKRPTRERRKLVPSSQLLITAEDTSDRANKGDDKRTLSQSEPPLVLAHAFQGANGPQVVNESLGPPVTSTTMGGPRRTPFMFRDEDFYSTLSLNSGEENDDTEEETHLEEELLLAGMHPPHSPSNHKRSRFLGTFASQSKNKPSEGDPKKRRAHSLRSELSHGSLRISNAVQPETERPSVGQRMLQDHGLLDGESTTEAVSSNSENKKTTFHSWDTKSEAKQHDGFSAGNVHADCTSTAERPGTHDYGRDWLDYLNGPRNSFDCFLSGRPTAPRSSVNSSYNPPGSLMQSPLRDNISVDFSVPFSSVHSSDSEGNSRFNIRRPLSPIRNRNPFVSAENHSDFPVNSAHEFDVRGAEDNTLTSQPQGAPLYSETLLLNPQGGLSSMDSSSASPSGIQLQGRFHMPGHPQGNIPLTFFTVSDFPSQSVNGDRTAASSFPDVREDTRIKTDPEKLKKLQESLLEEDSEEEGDLCRICQIAGGSPTNPLLEPCGCVGSLRFVHQGCLKKWLQVKITSGADLGAVRTCEMCKQGLLVDLEDFNLNEFYQKHQQSRAQNELMNSGFYLVLLLHLYEQRFAELMRLNHSRVARRRLSRNCPQPRPEENEKTVGRSPPVPVLGATARPRGASGWPPHDPSMVASASGKEVYEALKDLCVPGASPSLGTDACHIRPTRVCQVLGISQPRGRPGGFSGQGRPLVPSTRWCLPRFLNRVRRLSPEILNQERRDQVKFQPACRGPLPCRPIQRAALLHTNAKSGTQNDFFRSYLDSSCSQQVGVDG